MNSRLPPGDDLLDVPTSQTRRHSINFSLEKASTDDEGTRSTGRTQLESCTTLDSTRSILPPSGVLPHPISQQQDNTSDAIGTLEVPNHLPSNWVVRNRRSIPFRPPERAFEHAYPPTTVVPGPPRYTKPSSYEQIQRSNIPKIQRKSVNIMALTPEGEKWHFFVVVSSKPSGQRTDPKLA